MARTPSKNVSCPSCTTPAVFKEWLELARRYLIPGRAGFCEDCTPEYQARMKRENKCDNHKIRFFIDADKEIYGAYKASIHFDKKKNCSVKDKALDGRDDLPDLFSSES